MKIYEATHYWELNPDETQSVLVGFMTQAELDGHNLCEDEESQESYIRNLTNNEYGEDDFTHYFDIADFGELFPGLSIGTYGGEVFKLEGEL